MANKWIEKKIVITWIVYSKALLETLQYSHINLSPIKHNNLFPNVIFQSNFSTTHMS